MVGRERDGRVDRLEPLRDATGPGSHIIRSRLTLSKPAARASPTARARAIGAVQARQAAQFVVAERLDAEAQPIDAGVAERRAAAARSTVSGFASSVTSQPAAIVERASHAAMIRAISAGSSSDGVPPPK